MNNYITLYRDYEGIGGGGSVPEEMQSKIEAWTRSRHPQLPHIINTLSEVRAIADDAACFGYSLASEEIRVLKVQVNAYKTLQRTGDEIRNHYYKEAQAGKNAIATIESERDMNAILTEENEKLKAENERLKAENDQIWNDYEAARSNCGSH